MRDRDNYAIWPYRGLCFGEQIPLQIIGDHDKVKSVWLYREIWARQIGNLRLYFEASNRGALLYQFNRLFRPIYSRYRPSSLRQVQRIPSGAAGEIDCSSGSKLRRDLHNEYCWCIFFSAFAGAILFIPACNIHQFIMSAPVKCIRRCECLPI